MHLFELFLQFDEKVVNILESLCHKQQRLLGTSHYTWLKLFAVIHAVFVFVFALPIAPPREHWYAWTYISIMLSLVPGFIWWERRSLARRLKGLANPLRKNINFIVFRFSIGYVQTPLVTSLFFLGLLLSGAVLLYGTLIFWCISLAALFILPACDPLPPTTGKCSEWLGSLFLKTAPSRNVP